MESDQPNESKENNIRQLITQLEQIKGEHVGKESGPFDYTNDRESYLYVSAMKEAVSKSTAPLKVAVIVNHGSLWSVGKELSGVDILIRLDRDNVQLEHDKKRRQQILKASSPGDLLPQPNPTVDMQDLVQANKERYRLSSPNVEKEALDKYWYLSSDKSLQETKDFLGRDNIAFVNGDLGDNEFMGNLGRVLKEFGAKVVVAELTNVIDGPRGKDRVGGVVNALNLLPFSQECVIKHSAHSGFAGRSPLFSTISNSLEEYRKNATMKGFSSEF
jgi:hypothetical protein